MICLLPRFVAVALVSWALSCGVGVRTAQAADQTSVNWPSWRNDGSGVSQETGIPQSWSRTENVLWKTPIPGKGLSSPIVWNDLVFVTTAVPGTVRHFGYQIYLMLIWGLTLVALWCYVGGSVRDPLNARSSSGVRHGTVNTTIRKLLLISFCVATAYFALSYLRYHVSTALAVGVVCAFMMLVISHFFNTRRRSTEPVASLPPAAGRSTAVLQWLQSLFVLGMVGAFLTVVHCFIAADFSYAPDRTWYTCAAICCIGLIATVGSIPRTSAWRVLASIVAVGALLEFAFGKPASGVSLPDADQYFYKVFRAFAGLTILSTVWFCLEYFRSRGQPQAAAPAGWKLRPLALLAIGSVFFVWTIYFLPKEASLLQVVSVDRESGKIRWQEICRAQDESFGMHVLNTLATPTPVTDGKHVYAHFGGAGAYCLDFDGNLVWHHEDPVKPPHWGAASSLALWNDTLLITYDVDTRAFTLALNKKNGNVLWEADRTAFVKPPETGETHLMDSYSTPIIVDRDGKPELVSQSNGFMNACDLVSGREVWQFYNPAAQIVTTPVQWKDVIIHGGGISNYLGAVRLEIEDGGVKPRLLWEVKRILCDLSSPVVYGDYVYCVRSTGIATCREAASGKEMWTKRLPGRFTASPVAADGKIFFCTNEGMTTVVAAEPTYRRLSQNSLGDDVEASFAISRSRLFIRGKQHLYCIGTAQ
jgi:outer membrane protein assembly factor BamB